MFSSSRFRSTNIYHPQLNLLNKHPYAGYIEVKIKIPEIKAFNEDVLMFVTEDSAYAQCVPIQLGTLHTDRTLDLISKKNNSTKHKMEM